MSKRTKKNRIIEAALILELGESATLEKIKANYKKLMKKWHPDRCNDDPAKCKKMAQKISDAYHILTHYCQSFEYSFKKEDINTHTSPEDWWFDRFGETFK